MLRERGMDVHITDGGLHLEQENVDRLVTAGLGLPRPRRQVPSTVLWTPRRAPQAPITQVKCMALSDSASLSLSPMCVHTHQLVTLLPYS